MRTLPAVLLIYFFVFFFPALQPANSLHGPLWRPVRRLDGWQGHLAPRDNSKRSAMLGMDMLSLGPYWGRDVTRWDVEHKKVGNMKMENTHLPCL